jgi:hypothetical protein
MQLLELAADMNRTTARNKGCKVRMMALKTELSCSVDIVELLEFHEQTDAMETTEPHFRFS